jgi:hypothetical protein
MKRKPKRIPKTKDEIKKNKIHHKIKPVHKSLEDYWKAFLRGEHPEIKVHIKLVDGFEARSPMAKIHNPTEGSIYGVYLCSECRIYKCGYKVSFSIWKCSDCLKKEILHCKFD